MSSSFTIKSNRQQVISASNSQMDGIKDADSLLDYAAEAKAADQSEYAAWFKNHAKKRIDTLDSDYDYIADEIGLEEKSKAGDEIATALMAHIESQMENLRKKLDSICGGTLHG